MSATEILSAIRRLSVAERFEIMDRMWESLSEESSALSEAQKQELDRRLEEDRLAPEDGYTWEEVESWILSQR